MVPGILIALQINNWNEERIEQNQIREYALSLTADLQPDLLMLGPVSGQVQDVIDRSRAMAEYMQGRRLDEVSTIDLSLYSDPISSFICRFTLTSLLRHPQKTCCSTQLVAVQYVAVAEPLCAHA